MFQVYNFTTASGRQPVKEFINQQDKYSMEKIYAVIGFFKAQGFQLGTDYLRRMTSTNKLWELRAKYGSKQYRIFLAKIDNHAIVLLHAIVKKTGKTPRKEIVIAEKRLKKLET